MTDHPTPERVAPDQRAATPSGADVAFADLICADTGLLHVEFDAIIAANFPVGGGQPSRRPPRQTRPAVADQPQGPARRQLATTAAGLPSSAAGGRHPDAAQPATQPAWRQPGNGIDSQLLTEEVITTRTRRLGHERSRGPVTTIPPNRQSACSPHADRLQGLHGTPRW